MVRAEILLDGDGKPRTLTKLFETDAAVHDWLRDQMGHPFLSYTLTKLTPIVQ